MTIKRMQKTREKAQLKDKLKIANSFISVMQAFHCI